MSSHLDVRAFRQAEHVNHALDASLARSRRVLRRTTRRDGQSSSSLEVSGAVRGGLSAHSSYRHEQLGGVLQRFAHSQHAHERVKLQRHTGTPRLSRIPEHQRFEVGSPAARRQPWYGSPHRRCHARCPTTWTGETERAHNTEDVSSTVQIRAIRKIAE